MIVAVLILILSTALFFFYFQVTCRKILCRQFDREYFQSIANANRLEFPSCEGRWRISVRRSIILACA